MCPGWKAGLERRGRYVNASLLGVNEGRSSCTTLNRPCSYRHITICTMSFLFSRQRILLRQPQFFTTRAFTSSRVNASRLRQPGEPTGPNEPPTHIRTPPSKSPLKVWPILAILGLGTYLFNQIVEQRKGEGYQPKGPIQGHSPSGKGQVKPSHPH